jgi:hypothetical protein
VNEFDDSIVLRSAWLRAFSLSNSRPHGLWHLRFADALRFALPSRCSLDCVLSQRTRQVQARIHRKECSLPSLRRQFARKPRRFVYWTIQLLLPTDRLKIFCSFSLSSPPFNERCATGMTPVVFLSSTVHYQHSMVLKFAVTAGFPELQEWRPRGRVHFLKGL